MKTKRRPVIVAAVLLLLMSSLIIAPSGDSAPTRANPYFSNGGGPNSAYNDTMVNFTATYVDADGDAPVYVSIFIDGIQYNMTEIKGANNSYARGVPFFYTTYLIVGNHSYYFYTNNTQGETARYPQANNLSIWMKSRPSTGDPGNPRIFFGTHDPTSPDDLTNITFTAVYTDSVLGGAPQYMNVVFYDGRSYTHHNMTVVKYGTAEHYQGYFNTTLTAGFYQYFFQAHSGKEDKTVRFPSSGFRNLTVSVHKDVDHPPEFFSISHSPSRPAKGQKVDFQVTYKDQEGDPPADGVYLYYSVNNKDSYSILKTKMTGTNYTAGVKCTVNHTFDDGIYPYYFVATQGQHLYWSDTKALTVGTGINTTTPFLRMGAALPWEPKNNDTVYFNVTYQDLSGTTQPSWVKVYVGKLGALPTSYTLTYVRGNLSRGATYSKSLTMPGGSYYYYFQAGYSTTTIRYPFNSTLPLDVSGGSTPVVPDTSPKLLYGSHSPASPTTAANVTFNVTYQDVEGDAPNFVRLLIGQPWLNSPNIKIFNMQLTDTNYKHGAVATMSLAVPAGQYGYWFAASSTSYNVSIPTGRWYNLTVSASPQPDNKPQLNSGAHSPASPTSSSNITFTVTYTDQDGDAPSYIKLHINEITSSRPYSVYNMTWTGSSYVYGVRAQYILPLTTGNYNYYFTTSSNIHNVSLPPGSRFFTLTVAPTTPPPPPQQDRAPTLSRSSMAPSSPTANRTIYFSILYTDADNDAPSSVRFHLLSGPSTNYANYSMNVPRITYSNGVTCTYSTSLPAGTYYYYFTASSTNYTVSYPSFGTLSFNVTRGPTPPPSNRTNIGARAEIIYSDGSATIEVTEKEEGFTISLAEFGEDFIEIEVSSESGEDRVIEMALDPDQFDIDSPDDIVVKVDGKEISYTYVANPDEWSGDEPAFYIKYTETGPVLYILLPEADSHTITAKVPDEQGKGDDNIWYYVIAVLIIIVIAAAIAISLLTASQKKRIKEYYDDFDTGVRDDRIASGKIVDEDDIDWDDLIEAE